MIINITGFYKPAILLALYNAACYEEENTRGTLFNFFTAAAVPAIMETAEKYLASHQGIIDYISLNNAMKKLSICLDTNELDLSIYIREHGATAVQKAFEMVDDAPRPDLVYKKGYFMK